MKNPDIEQVRVDLNLPGIDNNAGRFREPNGDSTILYIGSTSWSIVTTDVQFIDYLDRRTSPLSAIGGPIPLALRLAGNSQMLEEVIADELRNADEHRQEDEKFEEMVESVATAEEVLESETLDGTTGLMKPQTLGKAMDGIVLSVSTEHQVHIIELDHEDLIIKERWHDGTHECERRMNVRELTHLLCNITDDEIASIMSRDDDKMGDTPEGDNDASPAEPGLPDEVNTMSG
jgi:hypothetical protein